VLNSSIIHLPSIISSLDLCPHDVYTGFSLLSTNWVLVERERERERKKEKMGGKYCNAFRGLLVLAGTITMMMAIGSRAAASPDYATALSKCILFFEGQRSGKLPSTQRITWRGDSALSDGSDIGVKSSMIFIFECFHNIS
jgi:hypothetical protein